MFQPAADLLRLCTKDKSLAHAPLLYFIVNTAVENSTRRNFRASRRLDKHRILLPELGKSWSHHSWSSEPQIPAKVKCYRLLGRCFHLILSHMKLRSHHPRQKRSMEDAWTSPAIRTTRRQRAAIFRCICLQNTQHHEHYALLHYTPGVVRGQRLTSCHFCHWYIAFLICENKLLAASCKVELKKFTYIATCCVWSELASLSGRHRKHRIIRWNLVCCSQLVWQANSGCLFCNRIRLH